MNSLLRFVKLDYLTVKPYFAAKSLLIYVACGLFLTFMYGNAASGLGVGMMLGTMFVGYPFAIGEKSNMDSFYATMGVARKTVVLGRYLFAASLNMLVVALMYLVASAGLVAGRALGLEIAPSDTLAAILALSAVFVAVQAIQLPMYFKWGYTKAKFLSLLPFGAVAGFCGIAVAGTRSGAFDRPFFRIFRILAGSNAALACTALALLVAMAIISYCLSVAFYGKREF